MDGVNTENIGPAKQLIEFIGYGLFGVKRNIMQGFQDKTGLLRDAVTRLESGPRPASLFSNRS